jgi:hypothetical protein
VHCTALHCRSRQGRWVHEGIIEWGRLGQATPHSYSFIATTTTSIAKIKKTFGLKYGGSLRGASWVVYSWAEYY